MRGGHCKREGSRCQHDSPPTQGLRSPVPDRSEAKAPRSLWDLWVDQRQARRPTPAPSELNSVCHGLAALIAAVAHRATEARKGGTGVLTHAVESGKVGPAKL